LIIKIFVKLKKDKPGFNLVMLAFTECQKKAINMTEISRIH
jgi:hypothetical protein